MPMLCIIATEVAELKTAELSSQRVFGGVGGGIYSRYTLIHTWLISLMVRLEFQCGT